MLENGDFHADTPVFKPYVASPTDAIAVTFLSESPVVGEKLADGKRCLQLDVKNDTTAKALFLYEAPIYIDATKRYKISVKVFTNESVNLEWGGYAFGNTAGTPLAGAEGKGVWSYSLFVLDGPTSGWQEFEKVIGPKGSDADFFWDPETLTINARLWIRNGPGKVILSDFSVTEL